MIDDVIPAKTQYENYLPALHLEVLKDIGISISELEDQSPHAWKALVEAQRIELRSLRAFVTRQTRHDFYYRHEKIIEYLLLAYSRKIPSHLRYMIKSNDQITPRLIAIVPIALYETTIHYYAHGEQELCALH
jgi:hypothetical protein